MAGKFMMDDIGFVDHVSMGGNYVEGPIIVSYTVNKLDNVPEARLYFQHKVRIPLMGEERDICELLDSDQDDLDTALDSVSSQTDGELLTRFSAQRQSRAIEEELPGSYIVYVLTNFDRGQAAATPYMALAPTSEQREDYIGKRNEVLQSMARVCSKIDVTKSLTQIMECGTDDYDGFLNLVLSEYRNIMEVAQDAMQVRSNLRRLHQEGYTPFLKYAKLQEEVVLQIGSNWVNPLISIMEKGMKDIHTYLFENLSLDVDRLSCTARLAQASRDINKDIYSGSFTNAPKYQEVISTLRAYYELSLGFIGYAANMQKALDKLEVQKQKLAKHRGPRLKHEKRNVGKVVKKILSATQTNRPLFENLKLKGNKRGLDKVKALLLMKSTEIEQLAEGIRAEYL
jgi:hypothetical protein